MMYEPDFTDEELGILPLSLDQTHEAPLAGPGFLERFGVSAQGLDMPQPTGFLSGLVGGFGQGLANRGQQMAVERAKAQAQMDQRARLREQANQEATLKYRSERAKAVSEKRKGDAKAQKEQADFERANPLAGDLKRTNPELAPLLARIPDDQRLDESFVREINKRLLPETPAEKRAAAAAERSAAAAERSVEANDRQNKVAAGNLLNQIADDYRNDPSISTYRGAVQNLDSVKAAAQQKNGFGDLALIISYVRATEPGLLSVVRQEEMNNVTNAVSAFDRLSPNLKLKRFLSGDKLSQGARDEIQAAAEALVQSRRAPYDQASDVFRRRADFSGVDPTLFMQEFGPGSAQSRVPQVQVPPTWKKVQ